MNRIQRMAMIKKISQVADVLETQPAVNFDRILKDIDYNIYKGKNVWETAKMLNIPEKIMDKFVEIFKNRWNKQKSYQKPQYDRYQRRAQLKSIN